MSGTETSYETDGYALVPQAAPAALAATLLGVIQKDMHASPKVLNSFLSKPQINAKPAYEFYGYRHPVVMGFHWGMTSRISALTGKTLSPTYAFFRVYQKGDICHVHSDRQACEHSFSLALAYSDEIVWPFEIGADAHSFDEGLKVMASVDFGEKSSRPVSLNAGDAILYQGCNYRHGRTTPNPNRWSAHLFLHWVDVDGPFSAFAFDGHKLPSMRDFQFPA
ncbi:MAG: hypothetical protein AAGB02_07835 [Pseudomonadota bacterium]